MRLREPNVKELVIMRKNNVALDKYFVIEPDTDRTQLVLLHKTRGRRRTINIENKRPRN